MKDKDKGRKGIFILLYRLMYMLPLGLAAAGQVHRIVSAWMEREAAEESAHSGVYQGAVYAVLILLSFLVSYAIANIIVLAKQTKIAGCALAVSGCILMMVLKADPGRLTVAGLLTFAVMTAADVLREILALKDEYRVVFLFPYFVVLFLFINFIPISDKPIDWTGVVRVYERIVDKGRDLLHRLDWGIPDYESTKIGFDGRASLFGKIDGNEKEVLIVSGLLPNKGATYLTGRVYSDFDGKEWQTPENTENLSRMLDTIETVSAIYETYPYNTNDVCRYITNDILLRDIRTEYVFTVPKVILGERYLKNLTPDGDNILFPEKKRFGFSYKVSGFMLNRGGEELAKYKRDITPETWHMVSDRYLQEDGSKYTYEDLLEYREKIKSVYGNGPQISDDLKAYIGSIAGTDEELTDYEKLKRIESWLSSHEYVTDVYIPRNRVNSQEEFLEYFLCEKTEGYCSYYATAFVLMSRSLGIPSRYVQGYRIPEGDAKEATVNENMAHAWPESYIEGLGWMMFEPTPGFKDLPEWGEELKSPEYYEELKLHPTDLDILFGEEMNEREEKPVPEIDAEELLKEQERIKAEQQRKRRIVITTVSIVVGSLLFLILVIVSVRLIIRDLRFKAMSGKLLVTELCSRCFTVLECLEETPEEGETLSEFADRIIEGYGEKEAGFIFLYERVLYAHYIPGPDEYRDRINELYDNYKLLKRRLRGRGKARARLRFLWRSILGTGKG